MKISGRDNKLKGELVIPGDKSISHRSVILLSLGNGRALVENILYSEDVDRTIEIFRSLGVKIESSKDKLLIDGVGLNGLKPFKGDLYCGNSGTTMRLLSGLMSGQKFDSRLTGDESLSLRPMDRVIDPLKEMGGCINSDNSRAPLNIVGGRNLKPINFDMKVASAQVKSAILLAGLYLEDELIIRELDISRNHTENMLKYLGIDIKVNDNEISMRGKREISSRDIFVAGDISSAAYFIVAGSILSNSYIVLKNVGVNETRDGILDVISQMGGNIELKNIEYRNNEKIADIHIKSSKLNSITIDSSMVGRLIDEIPIIAVAGAFANGRSVIKGVSELRLKETDRLSAIISELSKAGVKIWSEKDDLYIEGGDGYSSANFDSYKDHRIAMSMCIFALKCEGDSYISGSDCINISYPTFYRDLKLLLN